MSIDIGLAALRHHPLYDVARELAAAARPRRRRYFGPPVEPLNPHYAFANRNEQPTLEELLERMPPCGGLRAYLTDLETMATSINQLTDREVALRAGWFEYPFDFVRRKRGLKR